MRRRLRAGTAADEPAAHVDMTAQGGTLALTWDKTMATVPFTFGG